MSIRHTCREDESRLSCLEKKSLGGFLAKGSMASRILGLEPDHTGSVLFSTPANALVFSSRISIFPPRLPAEGRQPVTPGPVAAGACCPLLARKQNCICEKGGGVCLRTPWITSAPVRANWITTIPVQRSFTQTPAWTFVVHWNTASQIQQQQQMCTNHYDQHSYNCSWHGYIVTFSCFYQICFKSDLLKAWNINALCLSGIKEKTVVKSGWI